MKKYLKVIIYIFILMIIVVALGLWAVRYFLIGVVNPLNPASCGDEFNNGFIKAVTDNNPNFCLNFDFSKVNQYKNFKGYYSCSSPRIGKISGSPIIRGGLSSINYCLQAISDYTDNPGACRLMTVGLEKDTCYLRLAKRTNNFGYCNLIETQDNKQVCLNINRNNVYVQGVIKSIVNTTIPGSFVLSDGQKDYIINISKDTKIYSVGGVDINLADLKIGLRADVSGWSDNNNSIDAVVMGLLK